MNAIEIEEAISQLAEKEFSPDNFPFEFLESFGDKATTIKRLRSGSTNSSDLKDQGGVLKRNNIHILVCDEGEVTEGLQDLKTSPATAKAKANFVLATDGLYLEAEDLNSGETVACEFESFPNHFGFFLPLAGISTVKQIRNNPIDIQATGRLNRLYVELLRENEDWATEERRHDMNHFMARLIFCFFAEDTGIFNGDDLFTATIEQMSGSRDNNTDFVIGEIFRAMDIPIQERKNASLRSWADQFPYVNGGLFSEIKSGDSETANVPKFSRIARSYLLHAGNLDWKAINPDIFGSMIQAVADEDERGSLGMHYTSVPNILKVLNPLFLDGLKESLEAASDNPRKLLNLKKRIAKIRVFDPACGSGNFLVIAYKQMRQIEFEINQLRDETHLKSTIPLTNFRGIEIKSFSAEIARLALIIAEYQCDVIYRGQKDALAEFLPLDAMNWITCDNALRVDWLSVCHPTEKTVKQVGNDLFSSTAEKIDIDFENEGGETFICGNPPFKGNADQTKDQKLDVKNCLSEAFKNWRSLDYICCWFYLAQRYCQISNSQYALVSTNSICQGQNIDNFWRDMQQFNAQINFAVLSFKWENLARNNAGVTVVIIGGSSVKTSTPIIYDDQEKRFVENINPYLVNAPDVYVGRKSVSISGLSEMLKGNYYGLSEGLLLNKDEKSTLINRGISKADTRVFKGSAELIRGKSRFCLWFENQSTLNKYSLNEDVLNRINLVKTQRQSSPDPMAIKMAETPHQFREMRSAQIHSIAVPVVSSENRTFLPCFLEDNDTVFSNAVFALYDAPIWNISLIVSRIHTVWISTVCGKLKTDFRYSNTMGWNTFPVPTLTEKNKTDLTRCAEDILIAREAHFPATIADLYDPESMPDNLRRAHERNDEVLERIYIGRKFKNDTERLEKLFELYSKMTDDKTKAS